ncbi:MAG: hypothetical protein ABI598_05540 [Chloroflexota bacterium]
MIARRVAAASATLLLGTLGLPGVVAAHQLSGSFQSRLPLAVYLVGAAGAVALSFAFVLLRDLRATAVVDDGRRATIPGFVRNFLRAIGLIGWAWIMVQAIAGGDSDAEVSRLFAWNYGWVGVALISALAFPVWTWLDPFSTLYDIGAWLLRRLGVGTVSPAEYPAGLGRWPAVAGFAAIVWLELVASGAGSRTLAFVIAGYTVYSLAMMAQYGRSTWSRHGEIFSVWFGLIGRLAPFATLADDRGAALRRRDFAAGLREGGWATSDIVLVGLGTGSILFDGLSQTQIWVTTFGLPATLPQTALLAGFMALIIGAALVVARLVGIPATGAGLVPIAVGYLLAHYFTYLVIDGQRLVIALSDPLQQGKDYFGTAFFEPNGGWLAPGFVWTLQLAAVVGGHMIGAWGGHVVAARAELTQDEDPPGHAFDVRRRQIPLAMVMVALTTLTLWSLGQALFVPAG